MPMYEYLCQKCGHQFEIKQTMSEKALKSCPKCQEEALEKLISSNNFQLKGSGWYVTDYKKSEKKSSGDKG